MFESKFYIALVVPLVLLLSGAIAKKLVRGTGWIRSDIFLGVELSLSAMSAALVYLFELATSNKSTTGLTESMRDTGGFLALCFFLLLFIMSTHQDWESKNSEPKKQIFWLSIFSNGVGIGLLMTFILLVKGVN